MSKAWLRHDFQTHPFGLEGARGLLEGILGQELHSCRMRRAEENSIWIRPASQTPNTTRKIYEGFKTIDAERNVRQINQRYALERFCQAAASRGEVPPPFNGSIFTMDMPAGTHQFVERGTRPTAVNADNRDWQGLPFFWQNTRHPYWSMLARGDYDGMLSGFKVVRGSPGGVRGSLHEPLPARGGLHERGDVLERRLGVQ